MTQHPHLAAGPHAGDLPVEPWLDLVESGLKTAVSRLCISGSGVIHEIP